MDGLATLSIAPWIATWCAVVIVWLIERLLPLNSSIDPVAFFQFMCNRMAAKVLPSAQQTQQHFLSGALAAIVLIAPIVTIVALVAEFASYPWLFDAIILYVCLQFSQQSRVLIQINAALKGNKKQLARDLLKPMVLRETDQLSELGINKACLEVYILRLIYQQGAVLFWFVVLGPIAALSYRMCYEASHSWNIKYEKFARFGWFSHFASTLFQWVPVRLFSVLLLILSMSTVSFSNLKRLFSLSVLLSPNGAVALVALAGALNTSMSGPVIYDGKKIRRIKYTMADEATLSDHIITMAIGIRAMIVFLCLLLLILWGLHG